MKFKVGDRVRVKSANEIIKTLFFDNSGEAIAYYKDSDDSGEKCEIYFNITMFQFCGKEDEIKDVSDGTYALSSIKHYVWIDEWLEETSKYVEDFSEA